MSRILQPVFCPPKGKLILEAGTLTVNYGWDGVHIQELRRYAGAAIGRAVVAYPARYAKDASPTLGRSARITIDKATVFRGVIVDAPFEIDTNRDEVKMLLADDKWAMTDRIVGQPGIGTQGAPAGTHGFQDVGFETIINRNGNPNKDPASREFRTGSTAVAWTLKDVLLWLFDYYVDSSVARIFEADIPVDAYADEPSHLSLVGMNALQAVDEVVALTGQSWALVPGSEYSTWTYVRPDTSGNLPSSRRRIVRLFPDKGSRRCDYAGTYYAARAAAPLSIEHSRDVYVAISAPYVFESTYSNKSATPLLVRIAGFTDKTYAARFAVDVTAYNANNLGANLTAGSNPKPWLSHLCTRKTAAGDGYVTAAQIAAAPLLAKNEQLPEPFVWLSLDGDPDHARLVQGGKRIDVKHGFIDFEAGVDLMNASGDDPEDVSVPDWDAVGVWLTIATVMERPKTSTSDAGSKYLPRARYQMIRKPDLVPELRRDVWLPDLAGNNNAVTIAAQGAEETYVDISATLDAVVAAALAATSEIERPIELSFPFVPPFNLGDHVTISGRHLPLSGREVVIEVSYQFHEGVASYTHVRCSNALAGVDTTRFREGS